MDNKNLGSNELQFILEKQIALHRNLVELLREEYAHMGSLDVKSLAEVSNSKEAMLSEIWNSEQLRMKTVEVLCQNLGLDASSATLSSIADALPPEEADRLRKARTALSLLMAQAKEANSKNMAFAESSLDRIDQMKRNALGLGNTAVKENYSNAGVRQPVAEQGGRLLSTEA